MNTQDTTIQNQQIVDHEPVGILFIREIDGQFLVLFSSDGEYAGNVSDGSDCTFSTMSEASRYMEFRNAELNDADA